MKTCPLVVVLLSAIATWLGTVFGPVQSDALVWTSYGPTVPGPPALDAVRVCALAFDPTRPHTLYAATGSGLFQSVDGGTNWTILNTAMASTNEIAGLNAVVVNPRNPGTIYAAGRDGSDYGPGVLRSTDGGRTWEGSTTGLTDRDLNALAIDPVTPTTVYAGAYAGVFRSIDGGNSWTAINNGLAPNIFALAVNPARPHTLYAGTSENGIFRSTDGGDSWTAVVPNCDVEAFAIDPNTPSTIYAANGGVLESTDDGITWTSLNTDRFGPSSVVAVAVSPTLPRSVYAGTYGGGIFRSTDGAQSWTATDFGLSDPFVVGLGCDPTTPRTVFAATNSGVFRSTDAGDSWTRVNTGLPGPSPGFVNALVLNPLMPRIVYAGTANGGMFRSMDGGSTWIGINSGLANPANDFAPFSIGALAINPVQPTTLYAGSYAGLFQSTDSGDTWLRADSGLIDPRNGSTTVGVWALAIDPLTPRTLYAGTDVGIFKSANGGSTWVAANSGVADNSISTLAIDPVHPHILYAGAYQGGVFRTANGGMTWSAINTGLADTGDDCAPFVSPSALVINPMGTRTLYAATNHGVFRTTDSGTTWTSIGSGIPYPYLTSLIIDPLTPSTLYTAPYVGGVFRSTDSGTTWSAVNAGLTSPSVNVLAINPTSPGTLYAGTPDGRIFDTRALIGAACTAAAECPSGNCVDGICCDGSCSGSCQSCASRRTGAPNGVCAAVLVGLQTTNGCNAPETACDGTTGRASCRSASGQTCAAGAGCATGDCVDGICCDQGCVETCQSCSSPMTSRPNGVCAAVTRGGHTTNGCDTGGGFCSGEIGEGSCVEPTATPAPCIGDCDRSGTVDTPDLITAVNVLLGFLPVSACPAFPNPEHPIDIAVLIQAVNNALNGCDAH